MKDGPVYWEGVSLLKRECVNRQIYQTRTEARVDVFDYIKQFYNPRIRS